MIIDARVRPPYKSLTQVLAPEPGARPAARKSPLVSGYEHTPSMMQKSWELFMDEMDAAGVDMGILVGRQAGHRIISNDDIAELRDRYPDQFPIALAGINGANVEEGIREIERTLRGMHFAGIAVDPGWWNPPRYVDDPANFPLYQRCAELDGVLYLTWSLRQGPEM